MTLLEIIQKSKKDWPNLKKDELDNESSRIPGLWNEWHQEYITVHLESLDVDKKLKKLLIDKFEYYSGKADPEVYKAKPFGPKLFTKEKIEAYVENDPEIEKLRSNLNIIKEKDAAIKRILEQINQRSWLIKHTVDALKYYNNNQV